MTLEETVQPNLQRFRSRALLIGGAASVLALLGAFLAPSAFFHAYLFSYLFWLGIALGSMALLMVHHITGGAWGFVLRRLLEGAAMTLPLLAILFLPILPGMSHLYIWTHTDVMAADPTLRHKSHFFLNVPWFVVRAIVYFTVWIVLAMALRRWSLEQDRTGDRQLTENFQRFCGPGLVLYVLTMSLAAIDWIMSLEPRWYSTIFGLIVICGQGVSTFAFMIPFAVLLAGGKLLSERVSPETFRDLGNLMLAFVVLWIYMAFSQYLIIWSGDLTTEIPWYLHRQQGGWQWVALFLALFHFFVPFFVLLFGNVKRNFRALAVIALCLLFAHLVDSYWLVAPTFSQNGLHLRWLDIVLPIAIGGLWIAWFVRQLEGHPLVPQHDPRLEAYTAQEATAHG